MEHPFIMQEREKELFKSVIASSSSYLEFGLGGSTVVATTYPVRNIYSVDSSAEWIGQMMGYPEIATALSELRLRIIYIDIGKTKGWGYPLDESQKHLFPLYSSSCFDKIPKNEIDTVLIDGRFRVACALKTIEQCGNNNLRIMVHDFWDREYYHIILKYVNIINRAGTLGVFTIKEGVDIASVEKDYELYKYDPK